MRAIILAGGKGTRLKPYTTLIPKPLVPIGGKYSILEIILKQLKNNGFTEVTIAVNHLSQLIISYFGDGSKYGLSINYSLEEDELSTIGPLTLIENLPENFLVMNGDILTDLNFKEFYEKHLISKCGLSVATYKRDVKVDFGVISTDESGNLSGFIEKPMYNFNVSMGIYCINKSVVNKLSKGHRYGFDHLMLDSIKNDSKVNIYKFMGYWLDIGRPEDYDFANNNYEEISTKLGIVN
jgi:NDP-sugar pyrophosphorylase family protein